MDSYMCLVLTVLCLYLTGTCMSRDVNKPTLPSSSTLPSSPTSPKLPSSCDLTSKNESCPDGYCCVRDDFLFTETYCKKLGGEGSSCVTHVSDFECHCHESFYCASNTHGHIASVFGKCLTKPTPTGGPMDTTPSNGMTTTSPDTPNDNTTANTGDMSVG